MSNCKFCQIIDNKGIKSTEEVIFENNEFIVITDKFRKTNAGAICLVIPKKHHPNFLELPDESGSSLLNIISLISKSMQVAYKCDGIRIWTAVNKEAGQSIFHCHIHILACRSIYDRFIASFPGIYDFVQRLLNFGNNQLNSKQQFKLAESIRKELLSSRKARS